jgi:hypothetical protein
MKKAAFNRPQLNIARSIVAEQLELATSSKSPHRYKHFLNAQCMNVLHRGWRAVKNCTPRGKAYKIINL